MARATAATLKRLQGLEATQASRGVMVVPPPMSIDQWQELALPQQQALMLVTRAGIDAAPVVRILDPHKQLP